MGVIGSGAEEASASLSHFMDLVVLDNVVVAAQILSVLNSLIHPFYGVPVHGENKQTNKTRRVKRDDDFKETVRNTLQETLPGHELST